MPDDFPDFNAVSYVTRAQGLEGLKCLVMLSDVYEDLRRKSHKALKIIMVKISKQ